MILFSKPNIAYMDLSYKYIHPNPCHKAAGSGQGAAYIWEGRSRHGSRMVRDISRRG